MDGSGTPVTAYKSLPRNQLSKKNVERCAIRTRDLRLRRPTLYPAELIARYGHQTSTRATAMSSWIAFRVLDPRPLAGDHRRNGTAILLPPARPGGENCSTTHGIRLRLPRRRRSTRALRDSLPPAERVLALAEDKAQGRGRARLPMLASPRARPRIPSSAFPPEPSGDESSPWASLGTSRTRAGMMRLLAGRSHFVRTGWLFSSATSGDGYQAARSDSTRCASRPCARRRSRLSGSGEWDGVAGAYRIQGLGGFLHRLARGLLDAGSWACQCGSFMSSFVKRVTAFRPSGQAYGLAAASISGKPMSSTGTLLARVAPASSVRRRLAACRTRYRDGGRARVPGRGRNSWQS